MDELCLCHKLLAEKVQARVACMQRSEIRD